MKTTYQIDPAHTTAQFVVRHMMITNVRGAFRKITGKIVYDPEDVTQSSVEATIDTASIDTREEQRDAHLRSADFFNVAQFPAITFKSKSIKAAGDGELRVTGELTMHGVTKEVVLEVEEPSAESKDPFGNIRVGVAAKTKIKRSDFGLSWNAALEAGGVLVGDDIKIELDLSMIKAGTATA
jgi:polyisoprenoid-binding protein YceI